MIQKVTIFFLVVLFFLLTLPAFYFLHSQEVSLNPDKVEYNLPYPGILPDHPFFFVKELRDKILELTTRDTIKKAELYLLFSDKRIAMATLLAKSGKDKQAVTSVMQGEQYFGKIPQLVQTSKKQGVSASGDFIQRLKLSNDKHREVEENFLKDLPQGQNNDINKALDLNQQARKKLESL